MSAYIVLGGVAGSAAALGSAAGVLGGPGQQPLARLATGLAAVAGAGGAGLLVSDLGRPARMLHMVRVVRPTSVMNVGGLLLSGTTGAAVVAAALDGRGGVLRVAGRAPGLVAGVLGVPLSGYTGVLLASTAMPAWNLGQPTLPPLFTASGAATTGSMLRLAPLPPPARATVDVLTLTAQAAELLAGVAHDRRVAARPRVRAFYRAARGWGAGRWLTAASLAVAVTSLRRHPVGRIGAAVLGLPADERRLPGTDTTVSAHPGAPDARLSACPCRDLRPGELAVPRKAVGSTRRTVTGADRWAGPAPTPPAGAYGGRVELFSQQQDGRDTPARGGAAR